MTTPPPQSVLKIAEKDYPAPFLILVNLALPSIFGVVQDVFLRTSARKVLFEGVPVDCSTFNPLAIPVCSNLQKHAQALKNLGDGRYSFSFFGSVRNNQYWRNNHSSEMDVNRSFYKYYFEDTAIISYSRQPSSCFHKKYSTLLVRSFQYCSLLNYKTNTIA